MRIPEGISRVGHATTGEDSLKLRKRKKGGGWSVRQEGLTGCGEVDDKPP